MHVNLDAYGMLVVLMDKYNDNCLVDVGYESLTLQFENLEDIADWTHNLMVAAILTSYGVKAGEA